MPPKISGSPIIWAIRNFLTGRKVQNNSRYSYDQVARTQPPPNVAAGVNHKLSDNYYLSHDTRRDHAPPISVKSNLLQIAEETSAEAVPATRKAVRPGDVYASV